MFSDYILIVIKSLLKRKTRTILTTIGIIISISSLLTIILLSNGLKQGISEQFESLGPRLLTVLSKEGMDSKNVLTIKDSDFLKKQPYFEYVTPFLSKGSVELDAHHLKKYAILMGVPTEKLNQRFGDWNWKILKGRIMKKKDQKSVLLGYKVWEDLFDKKISINSNIIINNQKFRVIGILDRIGNQQDDYTVIMDIDKFRKLFNIKSRVDLIILKVKNTYNPDVVLDITKNSLKRFRKDDHFEIYSSEQLINQINSILSSITFILGAIALISLIIGSIGIMNSMFTNVLEKTKEIGIMKSIGATNKTIMLMFMLESGFLGLIGGIIGLIIGITLSKYIAFLITKANFFPIIIRVQPIQIILILVFSVVIGIISGYLPSKRATKLKPVDALRSLN